MSHAQHSLVANEPLCSMCVLHCCGKSCQSVFFCYAFVRRWRRFEQRGEMCACVESGFRAVWGCSSLFFVCSSSPSLPPSLPPSGSGSMHSTLTHTPTAWREHTHILHYLPRTCLGEDSMCVCELWGWKRECVWSRLTSTSIDPPLLSTTDPWHM